MGFKGKVIRKKRERRALTKEGNGSGECDCHTNTMETDYRECQLAGQCYQNNLSGIFYVANILLLSFVIFRYSLFYL